MLIEMRQPPADVTDFVKEFIEASSMQNLDALFSATSFAQEQIRQGEFV